MDIKLIDFGLAVLCPPGGTLSAKVGTPTYTAQEVMRGHYSLPADMWSVGVVFNILLTGLCPTSEQLGDDGVVITTGHECWEHVSEGSKTLLRGLLVSDPSKRLSAHAAMEECLKLKRQSELGLGEFTPNRQQPLETGLMTRLVTFHQSQKLRKAALTAMAMQLADTQLREVREQFQSIDKDHDGSISVDELRAYFDLTGAPPEVDMDSYVASIFDAVDIDGDGKLDYSEFCAAAMREGTYRREEALRTAFRVFDRDGNGEISRNELASSLTLLADDLDFLMSEVDLDGDGVLSFDEFRAMVCEPTPRR
jgi:calcium-dependent protein kinase